MSRGPWHFLRVIDPKNLDALFVTVGADAPVFALEQPAAARAKLAVSAAANLERAKRGRLEAAVSEVMALSNPAGEACLREAAGDLQAAVTSRFLELRSSEDRALWMWLAHRAIFEAARSLYFFSQRSLSARLSDAYAAPEEFTLAADIAPLEARMAAILAADLGEAPRVKIERFDYDDGAVLLSIAYEELWRADAEFADGGELRAHARRAVHHAAAKIESGIITVVSEKGGAVRRRSICDAVAEVGLGLSGDLARLPPVTYDLQRLMDISPFETDPADAISAVLVTSLTLGAPGLRDAHIEVRSSGREASDVRERALARLSATEARFAKVLSAELRVIFGAAPDRKRRAARLKFTGPTTCRTNPDCAEEALVRARYLRRWGLIGPRRSPEGAAR